MSSKQSIPTTTERQPANFFQRLINWTPPGRYSLPTATRNRLRDNNSDAADDQHNRRRPLIDMEPNTRHDNDRQCSDQPCETTRRSQSNDANYIQPPMEPQTITIARDNAPCAPTLQRHNQRNVIQETMQDTENIINQHSTGISTEQQMPANHANNTQRTSIQPFADNSHIFAAYNPYLESLPKIPLEKFNGDPTKWINFWCRFKFMVDERPMSNAQKLAYLQGLLIGNPKRTVEPYGCNGDMYETAKQELTQQCGNCDIIVNTFLDKLISHKPPNPQLPWTLINYARFINTMTHTLQQLEFGADLHSRTVLRHALDKLPYSLQVKWNQMNLNKSILHPTIMDFNNWLRNIADAHERSTFTNNKSNWNNDPSNRQNGPLHPSPTSTTPTPSSDIRSSERQPNTGQDTNSSQRPQCPLGDGQHPLYFCPTFKSMPLDERLQTVHQFKLCLNCLNEKHHASLKLHLNIWMQRMWTTT